MTVSESVYPEGVASADFDRDGDVDLCATSIKNGKVAWYENPGNGEGNWNRYEISMLDGADRFAAADMDGDGLADIVATGANASENGVYWFKAPKDPISGKWKRKNAGQAIRTT